MGRRGIAASLPTPTHESEMGGHVVCLKHAPQGGPGYKEAERDGEREGEGETQRERRAASDTQRTRKKRFEKHLTC